MEAVSPSVTRLPSAKGTWESLTNAESSRTFLEGFCPRVLVCKSLSQTRLSLPLPCLALLLLLLPPTPPATTCYHWPLGTHSLQLPCLPWKRIQGSLLPAPPAVPRSGISPAGGKFQLLPSAQKPPTTVSQKCVVSCPPGMGSWAGDSWGALAGKSRGGREG